MYSEKLDLGFVNPISHYETDDRQFKHVSVWQAQK